MSTPIKKRNSIVPVLMLFLGLTVSNLLAATPWLHTDGNQIKDPNGNVVILRGVSLIDLGATEMWYGGVNALIDRLTNENDNSGSSPGWYTRIVRLACYPPDGEFNSPLGWQPGSDDFYNNLLRPTVDYCKSKDIYAIIDLHYIADTWNHDQMTRDFWNYIAPRFANDSNVLFEVFNEPINSGSDETSRWLTFREDVQPWVDIIRSHASNNLILVGGPSWSQIIGPAATYPVSGSNIAYVAHVYPIHWNDPGTRSWIQNQITTCHSVHPVILTEWGFSSSLCDDITCGDIAGFGQPLKDFIEANGLSWTAWCANYEWKPPMFYSDYSLRVGPGEMGGFTKDWLYEKRNDHQPGGGGGPTQEPFGGTPHAIPGTIQAEDYDTGGEGIAYHDTDSGNNGGAYRSDGVDIENTSDTGGGYNVGWIASGEWLEYTVDVATAGDYDVEVRVASQSTGGTLHIEFDGNDVTGSISFSATGGWQNWTTVTKTGVTLSAGQQVMRIAMDGSNFNVNWVNFTSGGGGDDNLLDNPGFESGTTGWTGQGCSISASSNAHSGSGSVVTSSRTAAWAGPIQIITDEMNQSGPGNYDLSAWMRLTSGSGTGKVTARLTHSGGTDYIGVTGSINSSSWAQVAGTVNLTWSGTLTEAAFYLETTSGTTNFYADDCSIMLSGGGPTIPNAPDGLSATTVSSSQIDLSWTDNSSNEDGFKIERKTGSGGTYSQIATVGANETSYNDTGLSAATTYYYRVWAYNTAGNSSYSNEASATTQQNLPAAPSGLSATAVSTSQINLAWTDNSNNENGFKIERKTGAGGTYSQIATVGANVTSYNNTGLSASTTYYYRVRAYNDAGNSGYSNEASATTPGQGPYGGTPWAIPGNIQAEDYDIGGEGVAYHDTDSGNSGNAYRSEGVDIESTTDTGGGYNVGWIASGEWLEYTVNVATAGNYDFEVRVASQSTGGTLHIEFNGANVTGSISFSATGGWQNWISVNKTGVALNAGQQVMRIVMDGSSFNVNWVNITTSSGATNLLTNGDFENGTNSWSSQGCSISASSNSHSGSGSVVTSDRTASWAGPIQDITNEVAQNGQGNYDLSAWMKMTSGSATGKITMRLSHGGGTDYIGVTGSVNSSTWSEVSGTVNLTWSGTLTEAAFYVETTSGTTNFYTDDCSVTPAGGMAKGLFTENEDLMAPLNAPPEHFALHQNYPNPFNPQTTICYELPEAVHVQLEVFDMLGREVAVLVNGNQEAGQYNITFHTGDLESGVYVYKLKAGSFVDLKKMIYLK